MNRNHDRDEDRWILRLSKVERGRLERHKLRTEGLDDRNEPKHPNRSSNSRRSMRDLVRWRNKKQTGRYNGTVYEAPMS